MTVVFVVVVFVVVVVLFVCLLFLSDQDSSHYGCVRMFV